MLKKKKNTNKQNSKGKKVPLVTIPSFNCTEEIRIPTFSSTELKTMVRSIDLRKSTIANPYKKTISRKSTSKSVKQNPNYQLPKLKSIMRQFKELKLIHQNQRSKSKSPASCKSKSHTKYFPKKLSYHTLRTNPNSQINLALKLQKTIKKLNETDFFKDQDSLIPIKSSSDMYQDIQQQQILVTENEQQINMDQLRQFCSTVIVVDKPANSTIKYSHTHLGMKEDKAAIKIQQAWKRFKTKRLIKRYVDLSHQRRSSFSQISQKMQSGRLTPQLSQSKSSSSDKNKEIVVPSEDFYCSRSTQNDREEVKSGSTDYEQLVRKMKMEQLEKWNQIIKIISFNKSSNPLELELLLQKLAMQSEINKNELEQKANSIITNSHRKRIDEKMDEPMIAQNDLELPLKEEASQSEQSRGMQEYDSKKYIEYLDGDIFPQENEQSQTSSKKSGKQLKVVTISKRKQQILLQDLRIPNLPINLGETELYRSESWKALNISESERDNRLRSRDGLKKSTSQKTLKKTLQQLCESPIDDNDEINLDLMTKQFLQGSDPNGQNLDMVYSQQRLKSKLAQLNRMKHEFMSEQIYERSQQDEDSFNQQNVLQRSDPIFQLHQRSIQEEIRVEEDISPQQKMQIQVVEAEIDSDSQSELLTEEDNERGEAVSSLIFNTLLLQVLKDIATTNKMANSFKSYSLSLKPKVRKSQGGKRKKGFPTTKTQIQLFLDGLIRYLGQQQPKVFINLQVATGPSALEMLKYMHQSVDEQVEQQSDEDESNVMVIPNRVFDAFWQLKQKSIIIQVPDSFDQTNTMVFKHQFQLLKSFNKIFYRSLFDTFNECLDCQRNFGQYGRPFPWKRSALFFHPKTPQSIDSSVQTARKKMIQLSSTYCGLIIQKQQLTGINEQYIQQVHEDRLSRMLASDLMQAEERWMFYDDEETQILVQISNAIYTEMLIEIIEELYASF